MFGLSFFGWRSLGLEGSLAGEVSISSTRRRLESLVGTAAMSWKLMRDAALQLREHRTRTVSPNLKERSVVLTRHFDATPVFLRFGQLERLVQPYARYFIPVEEWLDVNGIQTRTMRWKLVTLQEYRKHDSRKPSHSGVLEILAQSTMVSSARYDSQWDWQDSFQVVREEMKIPPRIMQDSSGSTTFRCLETCGDSWDSAAIKNFAATSGTIIVNEMPDRGSSMIKLKHARAAEFATCQNILYDEDGSCAAHLVHNALVKQTREDDIVGHAHAVHYVTSLEGRRRQLLGGLKHLVSQDY